MSEKKVELIELEKNDLEMVLHWRNAPEVRMNMYTTHEITLEEHQTWFNRMNQDESKLYFIAYLNKKPIGVVGFYDIDKNSNIATWAFYSSPDAPRGSGAIMEYKALEYAFTNLKLHKLNCEVLAFNNAVIKLHTKFGFRIEGTHRDAFFNNGSYHNIIYLGIFPDEWNELKDNLKKKLKLEQ
ncbi:TPA: UDP-4-amino-4,6-dideoxy-N-acetyl-beta-L-altrosamine N-acetyltransferase [Providencia alcalifaciens]